MLYQMAEHCGRDGHEGRALWQGRPRGPITAVKPCQEARTAARTDHGESAHLGSCHLEKYPWEVAAWENVFGEVPKNLRKNYIRALNYLKMQYESIPNRQKITIL